MDSGGRNLPLGNTLLARLFGIKRLFVQSDFARLPRWPCADVCHPRLCSLPTFQPLPFSERPLSTQKYASRVFRSHDPITNREICPSDLGFVGSQTRISMADYEDHDFNRSVRSRAFLRWCLIDVSCCRAIAESLATLASQRPNDGNESDSFRAELAKAMAASKAELRTQRVDISSDDEGETESGSSSIREISPPPAPVSSSHQRTAGAPVANAPDTAAAATNDFLRQRRELEQARLARIREKQGSNYNPKGQAQKRTHSESMSDDEDDEDERARPLKKKTPPRRMPSAARIKNNGAATSASAPVDEGELFWNGELRSTANRHTERTDKKQTFRISELIGDVSATYYCYCAPLLMSITEIEHHVCHSFFL